MSQFELVAIVLVLMALFSWADFRLAVLPHTIGMIACLLFAGALHVDLVSRSALRQSKLRIESRQSLQSGFMN